MAGLSQDKIRHLGDGLGGNSCTHFPKQPLEGGFLHSPGPGPCPSSANISVEDPFLLHSPDPSWGLCPFDLALSPLTEPTLSLLSVCPLKTSPHSPHKSQGPPPSPWPESSPPEAPHFSEPHLLVQQALPSWQGAPIPSITSRAHASLYRSPIPSWRPQSSP